MQYRCGEWSGEVTGLSQVSDKSSGMYSPGLHSACGEELGFPLAVVLWWETPSNSLLRRSCGIWCGLNRGWVLSGLSCRTSPSAMWKLYPRSSLLIYLQKWYISNISLFIFSVHSVLPLQPYTAAHLCSGLIKSADQCENQLTPRISLGYRALYKIIFIIWYLPVLDF